MLAFITWDISPELVNIFGREIRWYGLCWAIGVLCTSYVVQKMYQSEKLPEKWFDSLFVYVLIGLIIGARLGHCLFYDPGYYLSHPIEILKIWEGGLASHGGAIGMTIGIWLFCRNVSKKSIIWALDRLIVGVAIGAAFIRIGNLMNSEIYGGPTTMPWGFNFVRDRSWYLPIADGGAGELPCHPTQIYEALIYFAIFILTMYMFYKTDAKKKQGLILGVSLIGIFLSRFFIEFLKNVQEPFELQMRASIGINMGQLLSIPFIIWGVWLVYNALKTKEQSIKK
uniref:prolipoprotein diacylglyceryl transferase n=1 Tax=uncultured Dysgonomonas sp. TaxID=206096 RepID=UPI00262C6B2C|nr:prolipoprotein diacylglyceryl transferase [uncultured Dysgonomonas sp.]